ncbi:MAG TPA: DUF58 domain-containing protein [Chloroflexi bacterium]|nr:MAG: hypothetical protein DRI46_01290 [Chloroflexota bacterium]HDD54774.1 DUF58 domain-containing protein [Chloroflexota bacterium]
MPSPNPPLRSLRVNSYLIPAFGLIMALVQLFFPFKSWAILASSFLGLTLFSYIWAWSLKGNISLEREMRFGWMQVGDRVQERIGVENDSKLPALWVRIIDHSYMPGYTASAIVNVRSQWYTHWHTFGICDQRGIYTLGPTSLETHDPLGIFTVRIDYSETVNMMVVPRVVPLPQIEIAPGGRTGEGKSTSTGLERTIVAGGVREYIPGDSLRWLHWPTTARLNKPYVRVFDFSPASNWWVLLDMDPAVHTGEGQNSTEEYSVILAASLVHEGLQQGKMAGLIAMGDELIWHVPDRGDAHLWRVLRSLALIRPTGPPLPEMLKHLRLTLEQRTSLVVITPNMDTEWANELGLLLRKGIVPTVLLLNPSAFGGTQDPNAIQNRLLNMNIKHYNFSDSLQDLAQFEPLGQEHQPGNQMREYVKTLPRQSSEWRAL